MLLGDLEELIHRILLLHSVGDQIPEDRLPLLIGQTHRELHRPVGYNIPVHEEPPPVDQPVAQTHPPQQNLKPLGWILWNERGDCLTTGSSGCRYSRGIRNKRYQGIDNW